MKRPYKGAKETGAALSADASPRGSADVAVLIDSSLLALFGSASAPMPTEGRLDFAHGKGAPGVWRAVSWPAPTAGANGHRHFFFALCGMESIARLDSDRTEIAAGDGVVPFPALARVDIDMAAIVDCLRESPQMAADVFDFLQEVSLSHDFAAPARARDLAEALIRATSSRDGFIEILARPECDGLLLQGWSFGLNPGKRAVYLQQDSLTRSEAIVGAFARGDLAESARGFVAYFKDARGERFLDIKRIYVRTAQGYGHLDVVDGPTRLEPRDAVRHLRDMLPQLSGDDAAIRALKRVTRPRFEGMDTAQTLAAPVRVAVDRALHAPGAGFLLSGWMLDPRRRVQLALLKSSRNFYFRLNEVWHRTPRPDVSDGFRGDPAFAPFLRGDDNHGFLVFVPRTDPIEPDESFYLEIVLDDETCAFLPVAPEQRGAVQAARDILGGINIGDPAFDLVVEQHLGPAIGAVFSEREPAGSAMPHIPLGPAREVPSVSIVVPLENQGADLDVNLARLAGDPDFDMAEFIFVASRITNESLTRLLARQMEFYGLSGSLVLSAEPLGYFESLDLGAREARGDLLLFLSQSVFPDEAGWLASLVAELKRQPFAAAASPTLLYEDHSIRYAGAPANPTPGLSEAGASTLAGYPSHWLADDETKAAETLAAECCLIRRDRYLAAGGFSREFASEDFHAADLSLRLGETGLCCLWVPAVTLYALDADASAEEGDYWMKPARRVDEWRFIAKWGTGASQPGREEDVP